LPPVGDLDQLQGANGDQGIFERARSSPRLVVAIAAGVVLLLAWIGWAIYITSSNGATAGLGVVIAWPAMLAALALISLPFIGGYLLIRRLSTDSGTPDPLAATDEIHAAEDSEEEPDGEPAEEEDESGDKSDDEKEEAQKSEAEKAAD
jgi:hypothetical protein